MKKNILRSLFIVMGAITVVGAHAAELSGAASVNITSDTAAAAKDIAFDEARRQIISDALGQYANPEQLADIVSKAPVNDLTELIASSSVDGEQQSDTTYSATITMTINRDAARQWMNDNYIQNWLTDGRTGDVFVAHIVMSDKLVRWIELNDIVRENDIDMNTQFINGNQITVEIPASQRAIFTIAVRDAGWRHADQDGVLHISK